MGIGTATLLTVLLVLVGPAQAAFPGRDGLLAVQPLKGSGIVLVKANGRGKGRACAVLSSVAHVCSLVRPQWSPDGRALVTEESFLVNGSGAPAVIYPDGSCLDCESGFDAFGPAAVLDAAFTRNPTLLTGVAPVPGSRPALREFGVDGLLKGRELVSGRVLDPVWSARGRLALVRGGWIWVGRPRKLRRLTPGGAPSWSPDGKQIVFDRRAWVMVVRLKGHSVRRLVAGTAPAWSPDGRFIAFFDKRRGLSVVRARGGRVRRVAEVTGRTVDWQPLPTKPAPTCRMPPGTMVSASSDTAIVSVDTAGGQSAWMGCLRADGRERLLTRSSTNSESTFAVREAAVGGSYAGLVTYQAAKGVPCSTQITLYDLPSGASHDVGRELCPDSIDFLRLNASGFAAWHLTTYPIATLTPLDGVSCPSVSLCVAGDDAGNVLTSENPSGGRDAWTVTAITPGERLTSISCPSSSLCVASGDGGDLEVATDPTGGASAWSTANVDGNTPISTVSCPSSTLCVAADDNGNILTSTNPTGGASTWTPAHVGGRPEHISCPSASLCVATDIFGNVLTSTDPTGGASAWSSAQITPTGGALGWVSCPSTSLCVASELDGSGANLAISTDPTGGAGAWTLTHLDNRNGPLSVTCATPSLCIASDEAGNVITSTSPTGGAGAWSSTPGPDSTMLFSTSCPSPSLCVEVNRSGRIGTSTDPTGGGTTWTSQLVDSPPCAVSTPCAAEQIYAYDSQGTTVLDSAPPGSGTSLANLQLHGDLLTWTHDGMPRQAQLR